MKKTLFGGSRPDKIKPARLALSPSCFASCWSTYSAWMTWSIGSQNTEKGYAWFEWREVEAESCYSHWSSLQ
jgi:hypothetical protein